MSAFDYAALEEGPAPSRLALNAVQLAGGLVGLALSGIAAFAASHQRFEPTAETVEETEGIPWQPFTPREGIEQVTIKPGPAGSILSLMPPAQSKQGPYCVFSYEPKKSDKNFAAGSKSQDAWLFGAKLTGATDPLLAIPTGNEGDVLKGRLLCWPPPAFPSKLRGADKLKGYDAEEPREEASVGRSVVPVILKDGTAHEAWWYYKMDPSVDFEEGPLSRFQCPVCGHFNKNDAHLKVHMRQHNAGGRGQAGFECDRCYASFKTSTMLAKHRREHDMEEEQEQETKVQAYHEEVQEMGQDDGTEHAVLVGLITGEVTPAMAEEYLDELEFLVLTAGATAVKRFTQRLPHPEGRSFIGKGKVEEIAQFIHTNPDINMVVFDDDLSGKQTNFLEETFKVKIIDRSSLILDIFAKRAQTAQAKAQVELAQMKYLLPRLRGLWTHLDRQKGGIGMRGPGETEIETDRRLAQLKIKNLETKLKSIDQTASTQRKTRGAMIRVALVGYTNVGKSTIMNLLSKSEVVKAEDKLFATLDTTVRKVVFEDVAFLLSDTVGFIRKLPTHLVESFKSTLDEVREADILLHVVDVSHPAFEDQVRTVQSTLKDIGADEKPTLMVFNKVDIASKDPEFDMATKIMLNQYGEHVLISATSKEGILEFKTKLSNMVLTQYNIRYPHEPREF
eukprot:gb/GEZN01001884.1/.p1 GENE.gb/GEZN01001884.1/~~gb/GEZN01001884.1/.p1  ORF type:complete len:676 (-),score=118.39 gb/GEZN01001884.1/:605-2632(-)